VKIDNFLAKLKRRNEIKKVSMKIRASRR